MATNLKHTTHAVKSWHTFMQRSFVQVPHMILRTQEHRYALSWLIRKHGGK